jgi:hypothetical protein
MKPRLNLNLWLMQTKQSSSVSERLRQSAIAAMTEAQRPPTRHEVREWIAQRDLDLSNEIATKCKDYVRIILSETSQDRIIKFKCISGISGQDPRLIFYGSGQVSSNPQHWVPMSKNITSEQPEEGDPDVCTDPRMTLFPPKPIPTFNPNVSQAMLDQSWFVLETLHPSHSAFWLTLQPAIETLKERVWRGTDPAIALQDVLQENPDIAHSITLQEVVDVLSREALLPDPVPKGRTITWSPGEWVPFV